MLPLWSLTVIGFKPPTRQGASPQQEQPSMTKVLKVRVGTTDGQVLTCDAVEWRGKLWLVPCWIDHIATGKTTPLRVIRFDNLPHTKAEGLDHMDFVVHDPIPKELFAFETPKESIAGYEYIDMPAYVRPEDDKKLH
jgi:hypothetical protein